MTPTEAIDIYERTFLTYHRCMIPAEHELVQQQLIILRKLDAENALDEGSVEHLKDMDWSTRINIRHGISSILGMNNELLALVVWNAHTQGTKFRMYLDSSKSEQLNGCDIFACNPNWRGEYPVQVKSVPEGRFEIKQNNWLVYPETLDRIVLINRMNNDMLHMDYKVFRNYCSKDDMTHTSLDELQAELGYSNATIRFTGIPVELAA